MNKILMIILDGFGESSEEKGNAIKMATMDNYNELIDLYPHTYLDTTGEVLGLPEDKTIDCEASHLLIGAGKYVKQDLTLCNEVLCSTLIEKNERLIELLNYLKKSGGVLHLVGLVSDGKVYSDIGYMKTFISHLKNMGVKKLYFHAITDGRDTGPNTSVSYLEDLDATMKEVGLGKIATICGRDFAMDRVEDYEKTKVYYDLLVNGRGVLIRSYKSAINACYSRDVYDEKLPPIILDDKSMIGDGDVIISLNYRSDRLRQMLSSFCDKDFNGFKVKNIPGLKVASLLPVDDVPNLINLIDKSNEGLSLGTYLSDLNLKQARIAEIDKFNNIGYYFNGCSDKKLKWCDNYIIPSYDKKEIYNHPELNLEEVTKQIIKCMERDVDFILVNIENPDVFGHIGDISKVVDSLNKIDEYLGKIIESVDDNFYKLILTSDHGNVEHMLNPDGSIDFGHTSNKVPFIIRDKHIKLKNNGNITQIAPTILKYMNVAIPKEMSETKTLFKDEE